MKRSTHCSRYELLGPALLVLATAMAAGAVRAATLNRPSSVALGFLAVALAIVSSLILLPRLASLVRWRAVESLQLFQVTGLGLFFTLLVCVLAVAAVNNGNNLLFVLVSALLASYLVSGALAKLALSGLAVGYRFPDRIHVAAPTHFRCLFHNEKRWLPTFSLRAETVLVGADGTTQVIDAYFPFVDAGGSRCRTVRHEFAARGAYSIRRVNLVTSFPFGFFQRGRSLHPDREVLVFPEVRPIEEFMHLLPSLQGERTAPRRGQGEALYQIRDYRSGDTMRHIHWRSTAKTGRLMVRDFSQVEETCACICLDNTRPHPRFERAVTLAASLVSHFHDRGMRVQLICAGGQSNPLQPQHRQVLEIFEMLARVREQPKTSSFWDGIRPSLLAARQDDALSIVLTSEPRGSVPAAAGLAGHIVHFDAL